VTYAIFLRALQKYATCKINVGKWVTTHFAPYCYPPQLLTTATTETIIYIAF
jgi:hypothetical protein